MMTDEEKKLRKEAMKEAMREFLKEELSHRFEKFGKFIANSIAVIILTALVYFILAVMGFKQGG